MTYWKENQITASPTIPNVINPSQETILENGWLIYINIRPEYNSDTQKIEQVGITESNDTATVEYQVIDLTEDELREKNVPHTITTLQGKLLLIKMGLLDTLEAMIQQAGQPEKVYWEYSATWERTSPILNRLAPMIGMSQSDLDQFFIEASKLK